MRYLAATELLYVMYIGSVARNRMSKKLERLLSVMLLPIINKVAHRPGDLTDLKVGSFEGIERLPRYQVELNISNPPCIPSHSLYLYPILILLVYEVPNLELFV